MKKIFYFIILLVGVVIANTACDDWTEVEMLHPTSMDGTSFSDEYYANLRAYKKSDHPVAFGWYGHWNGKGSSLDNCMIGLPDSVDFVSMWGNWKSPSEAMLQDLRIVQEKKGTKALVVFLFFDLGDQITPEEYSATLADRHKFWGWVDGDDKAIEASIIKYANAICDTIDKYNYDGFDLDWEISTPQPPEIENNIKREMGAQGRIDIFIEAMSKRIGPKSGTDKYFVIDGEITNVPAKYASYFNYFIKQAYTCTGEDELNEIFSSLVHKYSSELPAEELAKRLIVTEDFEKYAQKGGYDFVTSDGETIKSLEGMARWNPVVDGKKVRKGGVGTYHMEYEFHIAGYPESYPYMRNAIRLMNPPVK